MSTQREVLQQAAPAVTDWDVRGELAKSLTCWHRLTGQEAAELVTLYQRLSAPQQEVQEPLSDERIKDLLGFGDPTEQEKYLIRMGFNAARPPQRHPHRTVTYVCPVCAASLEKQE